MAGLLISFFWGFKFGIKSKNGIFDFSFYLNQVSKYLTQNI
ncbi:hypothetical protein NIES4101_79500 [Calothrix sp. NIES-4101]|nr:hypothetical protein NIES4101_79500 [Calothrix sp. NIES-4101]